MVDKVFGQDYPAATTPLTGTEVLSALQSGAMRDMTTTDIANLARVPRVQSVTSAGTVTPTFSNDLVKITAQAAALIIANPSGTAVPGFGFVIRIKDNGTARAITYGSQYRAIGVTLPTTTVISKTVYLACIWNSDDSMVDVVAVAQQA